ncbi:histidine--tRNA ligase [Candidatus Wolfebacteria bacterium]|nr:histidine--tRNA ligase [Candidatus Wolfebacteria bacterium]
MARKKISKKSSKGKKDGEQPLLQTAKGMRDILPEEQAWWHRVRDASEEVADFYNFMRIDTPLVERAELFERGVGVGTDIVEKEMYFLKTRGDRLVLRPEGTASAVRAYLEHSLSRLGQPVKLYYIGPMFRHEQPQEGRYRQHHQVGFEILGAESDPLYDAQVIVLGTRMLKSLKLKKLIIRLNSIGCRTCRPGHRKKLVDYYRRFENKLCKDCKRRLNVNPLRLLDCKNAGCAEFKAQAPIMVDYLCSSCRAHFKGVLEYLDETGLSYTLDPYLVRGLDYYNRTVVEFFVEESNIALGGGGRYDYLGELLAGRRVDLPAVGISLGIERLVKAMSVQGVAGRTRSKPRVFLIQIGEEAKRKALGLIEKFHEANVKVIESLGRGSLKSQLRVADKEEVDIALLFGQREVFEGMVIIRDMKSGAQETVPLEKVVEEVKRRL